MSDYWQKGLGADFPLSERKFLHKLAGAANGGVIVNIGVNRGTSLHCLAAGAPKSTIYAIDIEYKVDIFKRDKLPDRVEFITADSTLYNEIKAADFVFVDGDHEYAGVTGDIENWTPRISEGGIIAFHDYNPPKHFEWRLEGVKKAVDDWHWFNSGEWEQIDTVGSIIAFRRVE